MNRDNRVLERKSIRLKNYDYTKHNGYFITICVQDMESIFGVIKDNKVILNELGNRANEFWLEIPKHFHNVVIDQYVIMPNHIHGIIGIIDDFFLKKSSVGVQYIEPRLSKFQGTVKGSIGSIIRSYKASVTRWANLKEFRFKWQRNYYDRIIRTEKELENIRGYIFYNPLKWYYEHGTQIDAIFEK